MYFKGSPHGRGKITQQQPLEISKLVLLIVQKCTKMGRFMKTDDPHKNLSRTRTLKGTGNQRCWIESVILA